MQENSCLLSKIRLKIFFVSIFVLLFSNICSASPVPVLDGSVPSWITGEQNTLVQRMRAISASGLGTYFPHTFPPGKQYEDIITNQYNWARWASNNTERPPYPDTTCAYACSIALRGTPYGASEDYGLSWDEWHHDEDIINVDIFRQRAEQEGDWRDASYKPKPGDLAVTYGGGHIVMVTESGGEIAGGSGAAARAGALALAEWPQINAGSGIVGYIETSKYSDSVGLLNNKVDWGLDMLATIADGLNDLIDQFTVAADNVMSAMSGLGTTLILLLIIIDFATNAMECALVYSTDSSITFLPFFIRKLMEYAFLLFIFMNWAWVINTVFLSFAQDTASVVAGGNTSSNLTQPQFLLVKGMEAISPCLNFISNAKGLTDIKNWPLLALLVIVTFFVMFWLMFSAIYLAFIFIEFYMVAAFNAIFIVFPALRFTKFIGEGGLGSLIKATIKLFVAACLVYVLAQIIDTSNMLIEFPGDINGLADGTLRIYIMLCIHICVFCYLVFRIPGKIADIFGGKVELPG